MGLSAALLCDFYKLSHRAMYPRGTQVVYSTWTPRASKLPNVEEVVAFGHQMAIGKLTNLFRTQFFGRPKEEVMGEYCRIVSRSLGVIEPDTAHLEALHDLGYLPLLIRALPEGTVTPLRVPHLTVQNTHPSFFWLTNYVETFLSCQLWQASTSATLAREYRKLLDAAAAATGADPEFVPFQGHDFSMRGMSSLGSAMISGMAHLTSFVGTDTIPAIQAMEDYYFADVEKELVGTSVPATEHSVQCAYGNDEEYIGRVISEVHPDGIVSVVSDGYDFWDVIGRVLPKLKPEIMAREGKVVIRPDSGDPVKIVCGDPDSTNILARAGAVQCLWDTFGGTVNEAGYKVLDPHVGLIYGDAITRDRASAILGKLMLKGFASSNIVFGIGSYTYQYNTRDSLGWAMKATACIINGQEKAIFKTPKTDDGTKHSQKGRVVVQKCTLQKKWTYRDGLSLMGEYRDELQEIYRDGKFVKTTTLAEIRERLRNG